MRREGIAESLYYKWSKEFLEAGKQIIEGLKTGIKNAWSSLKESVKELFKGLLGNVKELLGIGSPSKVFAEIGRNIPKGMMIGIQSTMDLPIKELDEMTSRLIPEGQAAGGSQITNTYYLTANYKHESELTLTERVRILNLLGSVA